MSVKMTRYKHADFADDDSVGSVQLTEGISSSATHIRYHTGTSMWKRRSMLEKALLLLVGTLLFVVMVLAFLLSSADRHLRDIRLNNLKEKQNKLDNQSNQVPTTPNRVESDLGPPCLNATCIHISSDILASMDSSINPCDDFYAYACNGWLKANPIPDGKTTWSTFMKLEQQNQMVIKRVLEKPIETLKSKAEQKAKLYYESCLDVNETVEALGSQPMLDLLLGLGGWNVTTKDYDITEFDFQMTLQVIQNRYNIDGLFSYAVGEDDRNSSRHVLQVDQSGLTLPTREHYLNVTEHKKILDAYLEYMTKVGVLLGGEQESTRRQMKAVIEFETKMANITIPNELRRDEEQMYNLYTITELQEKAGFINWRDFFENALHQVKKKVNKKDNVVVYAPDYLKNLTILVKTYQQTVEGNVTLNNYLIWQIVKNFVGCLSKPFRDANKGLRKALVGAEGGEEPQWRYCVADTNNVLGFAVGAIFVREVFQGDSKIHAEAMINNVRNAFKKNFKNLDWMDKETREAAEAKADAISDMIGYPDFIQDPKQLDERYKTLEIRGNTFFQNNIKLMQYTLLKNLEKINQPVNKTSWGMSPSTVNAYYTPTKNQMVFPAGILQNPFYDPKYPASLNYGGMGVVMGHELTHGFDDQGREFDKEGNLHQWWNNKTIERFKTRTKCVSNQYKKYQLNEKYINGNQTLGENIADNGGLKAAYHAYLEYMKDKPTPQPLPGLQLSDRQLFFVAFAQVWCSAISKESTALQIEKDSHSPAQYRVIGSLSNLREFSEAFRCEPGSRMNPKNKCELW
ncbi:endothelin-converting enzyme homolog isoform X2 [Atheta coriaria]|uniref:endothelin-converting enzyme homolog isoform X2 n=1 Tax=Dalotia coriaria TaxID=877792 RepID=UPI0031F3B35F